MKKTNISRLKLRLILCSQFLCSFLSLLQHGWNKKRNFLHNETSFHNGGHNWGTYAISWNMTNYQAWKKSQKKSRKPKWNDKKRESSCLINSNSATSKDPTSWTEGVCSRRRISATIDGEVSSIAFSSFFQPIKHAEPLSENAQLLKTMYRGCVFNGPII